MPTISPDELTGEIFEIMQTFNHTVVTAADQAAVDAAKNAIKELRITSPSRTGKYARGWTYKKDKSGSVTIYNKARPGLTHLLEHGHPIRGRGKTATGYAKPKPHISAAETHAITAFEHYLKTRIEKGD